MERVALPSLKAAGHRSSSSSPIFLSILCTAAPTPAPCCRALTHRRLRVAAIMTTPPPWRRSAAARATAASVPWLPQSPRVAIVGSTPLPASLGPEREREVGR